MQKIKENANDINLCSMILPCMSLHDSLLDVFCKFCEYYQECQNMGLHAA